MGVANLMLNGHTETDVAVVVAEPGVGETETVDVSYICNSRISAIIKFE
jgi:hypothetical protein